MAGNKTLNFAIGGSTPLLGTIIIKIVNGTTTKTNV